MTTGIFELAFIICLAAFFGLIARALKQPLVVAYLTAGLVVGAIHFFGTSPKEVFKVFSDLGVMFLLFLVGLEINYTSLRFVGKPAFIIGFFQVFVTASVGFFISRTLGFSDLASAYIGIALAFSSTVVVVKLLTDRKELESLYGKLSVGMLLVQDVIALLVLTTLTALGEGGGFSGPALLFAMLKAVVLLYIVFFMSRKVFPTLLRAVGGSQELLFLSSVAWLFIFASLVHWLGFSIEIAGFLAGLALGNSFLAFQIANRIRPLRDFFMVVFFVMLGSSLVLSNIEGLAIPVILFSLFVLIGNPLIILVIMGSMGYSRRTSFFTGVTAAQISEFSLILAAVGLKLGHLDERVVGMITAVGITTFILSAYAIVHADTLFARVAKYLAVFERRKRREEGQATMLFRKPIILIGYHRTGRSIARHLNKEDLLVIDFDPEVVQKLRGEGYACIFGDVGDGEVIEKANIKEARLVISTIPGMEDDILLVRLCKDLLPRPKLILRAESEEDALCLYKEGADYVLLPHVSSGHHLGATIASQGGLAVLDDLRQKDMALLRNSEEILK